MLDKFLNRQPKPSPSSAMDIENRGQNGRVPWVEKYRPHSLDELSYQSEVTGALKNIVQSGNIPHLLLYGPAGTGKTSAILAMAKQIFGGAYYRERIIELNASDERGINVIREKVKKFAQKSISPHPDKSFSCPRVKIIILDEADLLTNDAQSALRRIIEDNSATTRFCIICNYITKIIEPLASRCIKFRFRAIPADVQFEKLEQICLKEKVTLNRANLQLLVEKGDLRQSINSLQSLSSLEAISECILPISNAKCSEIFYHIQSCSNLKQVFLLAQSVAYDGYAVDEILSGFFEIIIKLRDEKTKAVLLESLGGCGQQLENGGCELPLVDLFTTIFYVMNLSI